MKLLLFLLTAKMLFANINWLPPEVLFTSPDHDGSTPQVFFDEDPDQIEVVFLAEKPGESLVLNSHFDGETWEAGAFPIYTADAPLNSLRLGQDHANHRAIFWVSKESESLSVLGAQFGNSIWDGAIAVGNSLRTQQTPTLNTTISKAGSPVSTWQNDEGQLEGSTFNEGFPSETYLLSEEGREVTRSLVAPSLAIYDTIEGIFGTVFDPLAPPIQPKSTILFPLPAQSLSLDVDGDQENLMFLFVDNRSGFLIGAHFFNNFWTYRIVDPNRLTRTNVATAIAFNGARAAATWATNPGHVYVNTYDSSSWALPIILDVGMAPSLFILPENGHVLTVWISINSVTQNQTVKVSEFDLTSWSSPITLSNEGTEISNLQVRSNGLGTSIVSWSRKLNESSKATIEVARGFLLDFKKERNS
ncbi:MAG: hypothetical protein A3D96_06390 [Chlamydiae bacterium RIFCSPHIGHO2_12_FULL_44_59]|nr:MAG: hypothetical protein A2796_06515 [Chlamydiae bacterium RIFCSPHIGHO2_01_FULL_44_39]OGN59649.1 MAG: hypothetical protein A3D96_06390 [Chlamydiae bacterium RIFCSPHIGHO2_12_FULL_44_59]OGN65739.1 MAG: hypothetical protein A2978_07385 [Chlamydiae bacterium RIFCSPLOWO2_01_FULL_44_52]OGN67881.1 MAG: hypothetical protein A3I67_05865 [Chlamydiae bacterium RIFCSPLOWO2_02_FULL_45_22]OGN69372.1 MAG: hypothetical protein A3F79_06600 [Chlamydiae bacterium RIFCSPLOWO2_12_FULL_45_20]